MDYWLRHKTQFGGVILLLLVTIAVGFFPVSATAPSNDKTLLSNSPVEATSSPEWGEYQYRVKEQYSKQLAYNQAQRKPVVKPKPAPQRAANTSKKAGVEQWRGLVGQYDWPVDIALAIMACESGGNPTASSPTDDHGLMQIHNGLSLYGAAIYDPAFNIKVAYEKKYKTKNGWRHWTTYKNGCYQKYI